MAVTHRVRIQLDTEETQSSKGIREIASSLSHSVSYDSGVQASGTAASQQDRVWSDAQSVANGAPDTWDLAGTLTSELDGSTVTFVEVTSIYVRNKSTTTGQYLQIGGGSNPFITWLGNSGDIVNVGPGGVFLLTAPVDGWTVTATTGDILQIASASGTISYDIQICGRSA